MNEGPVLRITTEDKGSSLSLRLEGRVEGPWVEVLRKAWISPTRSDRCHEISVDLGAVSFADPDGRKLLLTMKNQGVALMKLSGFMREVLERDGSSLTKYNS